MKIKKDKKPISKEYKKAMLSTFILLFPCLLITLLVCSFGDFKISSFAVALFVFQAILIKNFIEDKIPIEEEFPVVEGIQIK